MPQVAQKARQLTADESASFSDLAKVIETDQAIATRVLKLANSSYYGVMGTVTSIQHASVVLGMKTLNELLTLACASSLLGSELKGYGLKTGDLWRHSIAVSVVAEKLVEEIGISADPEIFTAALLHNIGKLLLGQHVADYLDAIKVQVTAEKSFQTIERDMFGTDHAEIGARILQNWSFPDNVVNAVRWHHEPDLAPEQNTMTDVVHAANVLCQMIGIGTGREGLQYEPAQGTVRRLGLKAVLLEKLASQTLMWIEELNEILAVQE